MLVMLMLILLVVLLKSFSSYAASYKLGEEQTEQQGTVSFPKIRYCHIIITPIILLGRLLMRRNYRSIIVSQVDHHNINPP